MTLQLIAGLRTFLFGNPEGIPLELFRFLSQIAVVSVTWWVTCWLLLFGRVGWRRLILGSILTGVLEVAYSRASGLVMPKYVEVNADQFGTLGIILAISSWLIGFAGILVGSTWSVGWSRRTRPCSGSSRGSSEPCWPRGRDCGGALPARPGFSAGVVRRPSAGTPRAHRQPFWPGGVRAGASPERRRGPRWAG